MSGDSDSGAAASTANLTQQQIKALSVGKQKSIFKKEKASQIKKKIEELKAKTAKLKKKNLSQRVEKKEISKEIKRLKVSLKVCKDLTHEQVKDYADSDSD